uniref:Venom polypeptide n=1 Tax=Dolopus genitalis TaxID=2488630 RepID=A0A3G5BIF0_DOLGE|nr:venom polypeptide [Dolopus genitalis]
MKFAIFVLLGLCAIVAHASYELPEYDDDFEIEPQNKITDEIRAKIEELIKRASAEFGKISDKVSEIMSRVREHARKIIMKAKDAVDKAKDDIEGKLDELKKKGGAFAECAKKLRPEYRQVEQETMTGLKKCAGDAMISNEEHRQEVGKAVAAVRVNLREIRDQVADCLGWNPIKTGKCIFEKTSELKKLVDGVVSASRDALRLTNKRAREIVTKVKACNSGVLNMASQRVKELNEKLSDCYKNAGMFY